VSVSRRQFVGGAGVASLGLLAGCGRLPWQGVPAAKVPRLGYLALGSERPQSDAFLEGLQALGYVEGQNLIIDWRFAEGHADRLPDLALELVQNPVDVIVGLPQAALATKHVTGTIPIVLLSSSDPVGIGLVASFAHPGGNVTGLTLISPEMSGKRLQLLSDVVPGVSRVAVLWNADNPEKVLEINEMQTAARVLDMQLHSLGVRTADEFEGALDAATQEHAGALIVLGDALMGANRSQLVEIVAKHRLPAMYETREFVVLGGLLAYGPSLAANYRRAAYFVDKVLKGTRPGDLPIERPMTFDFVVNLKTAHDLGITFPNEIMLQVTEVIQ
jgi:putative ABC transport system substrate-binding protein